MLSSYLYWQFIESPQKMFFVIKKTIFYLYHQFSISFLIKTLFEPWKKDIVGAANPSLQDMVMIFASNLISRFMGFIVRTVTIIAGIIIIIITAVVSIVIFVFWIILPLIAIYMIYKGIFL